MKLSLKHFSQLMAIVALFSVMFLYLNVNNQVEISPDYDNPHLQIPIIEEKQNEDMVSASKQSYYVVFSGGSEIERRIYDNVRLFLDQMKQPYEVKQFVTAGELQSGITLIFCNTHVSEGMDVEVLGEYVKQGGQVIFAAGIPEGFNESYLLPLMGIIEKGNRAESNEWFLQDGFLPEGGWNVVFPDFQASTIIKANDEVEILIEDKVQNIPIVYRMEYGKGSSLVVNGTLLENRYSGGIFAGAVCSLKQELLYPVIGACVIFLEDFPFVLPGYDKECTQLYGRSMESVERELLWPFFVSYASGYNLKYTMNLYEPLEETDISRMNQRLFNYLVKENIRYSGEVMLSSGYEQNTENPMTELLKEYFPQYKVQAYSALYGEYQDNAMPIKRGNYIGDGEKKQAQDFGWDGRTVSFPVVSSGTSLDECVYQYLAGLSLYGVVSHSVPAGEMIYTSASYEVVGDELGSLLGTIGEHNKWLEGETITGAAEKVISYSRLLLNSQFKEDVMTAHCSNFTKGQKFILYSEKGIKEIQGAKAYKIRGNYYCIEADNEEFSVLFK